MDEGWLGLIGLGIGAMGVVVGATVAAVSSHLVAKRQAEAAAREAQRQRDHELDIARMADAKTLAHAQRAVASVLLGLVKPIFDLEATEEWDWDEDTDEALQAARQNAADHALQLTDSVARNSFRQCMLAVQWSRWWRIRPELGDPLTLRDAEDATRELVGACIRGETAELPDEIQRAASAMETVYAEGAEKRRGFMKAIAEEQRARKTPPVK